MKKGNMVSFWQLRNFGWTYLVRVQRWRNCLPLADLEVVMMTFLMSLSLGVARVW
jgi:hypothetical protein